MVDRVIQLRNNPNKNTRLPTPLTNKQENQSVVQIMASDEHMDKFPDLKIEDNDSASASTGTVDLHVIMQMLNKMQTDTKNGFQELKKELKEEFTGRLEQVNTKVAQLVTRMEQGESYRSNEMKNIQDQIDAMNLSNSTSTITKNQPSSTGDGHSIIKQTMESTTMAYTQNHNLLRLALDKQIDELKPYFGKKQENIDLWIKKIDKLAEISRMQDDEVFTLAKLKLQGDAEKWWDNKKKEIDSWPTLKNKLIDTFGSLGKSNKLQLEALLHRRQQNLNEPATKYWNDMMSNCSAYDENMSTQDRVWRIFNGALPEFRCKYENKVFDDVDQLLKALIQHEENRLRTSYEEQEYPAQIPSLACTSRNGQDAPVWNHQQFSEAVDQAANHQQRPSWNNRPTNKQQSNGRSSNGNNNRSSMHPN